ncbi:acyl-CoA-binding domain-containing protein 5-like isoform X3 [Corythoichthys intestinalis]|nr:acyl-CoA-binding domain-containing protein 5-like isoform X3 [Corythoichthys intestinalis]
MVVSQSLTVTMAHGEDRHSLKAKFAASVKVIRSLPKEGPFQLSDDMMLMFYSYYKQATVGPCTITRPTGFWESHGKNKWDAWSSLGNMTKEESMKNYVENIQLILETMPVSNEVSDLVQKLGNFYIEEEDGGEENEENRRPFTRPYAKQAVLDYPPKTAMEGFGDLWDDIQNFEEECGMSFNGKVAVGYEDGSEYLRNDGVVDKNNIDEDEAKIQEWSSEPRLQDAGWRCYTRGSSSSVEPSTSSLTHSSLNSEVEEEELAYSKECSTCNPIHTQITECYEVSNNYDLKDSDNEEFCDSMDHPAMEKILSLSNPRLGGSTSALGKEQDLWFESSSTLSADHLRQADSYHEESYIFVRESQPPKTAWSSQLCLPTCDSASRCTRHSRASWENINEQIVAALLRLQDDMTNVLHRLNTLEGLSLTQSRSSPRCSDALPVVQKQFLTPSWWPFNHSPVTVVMTALWPAVAYGLVQMYSRQKKR